MPGEPKGPEFFEGLREQVRDKGMSQRAHDAGHERLPSADDIEEQARAREEADRIAEDSARRDIAAS